MIDVRFLKSEQLEGLASPTEYVDVVREGYRQRGNGAPAEPRTRLSITEPPGILTGYFAILPESNAMGGYTYSGGFGSEDTHFVLPLFEVESGETIALIDGASMNPFKTGAAGAVAVDELAREDASRIGIIGSGTQARGQLLLTDTVREFEHVSVYSRSEENRESFAADMNETIDPTVEAVESSTAAVTDVDVLITATTASEPVFNGEELESGTHVTAMGQYHPKKREIDSITIARSKYVLDLAARTEQDAGAYMAALEEGEIDEEHLHGELGEVVAGSIPGRENDDEITVFDSGGTAIETVAAAKLLYDRACEKDLGTMLSMSSASEAFIGR